MSDLQGLSDDEIRASMLAAQQAHYNVGAEHSNAARPTQPQNPYDPTADMSGLERFTAGMGRGFVHTGRSAGNLVGLVPDSTMQNEKEIDAPLLNTPGGKWGNIAAEAAITAPVGMGAIGGIGQMGKLGAAIAEGSILNPAAQGALQGLITSDPGERAKSTSLGALTGGGLGALGAGAGKLVHGLTKTPEAETLLKEGISLTPGQLNPGGAMNQFEQAMESIPGAKQVIHGGRENAEQQFQAAVIRKGAAPGATIKPSENINKMLQDAYESYTPLYDQAKGYPVSPVIMNTGQNVQLADALQRAASAPGSPGSLKKSANEWLQDQLTKLPKSADSSDLLSLRSNIRARARQMNLSTDINAKDAAGIYEKAANSVTDSLRSQLPKDALSALDSADSNYGNYKIIENAVAKSKDNLAGLTPQKLSQAIYDSISDPQYARGAGGQLRDLAHAGTAVFQTVSPPTGARVATLGTGALAAMKAPFVAVPAATGMLGLTGTNVGRRLAAGMTAPQRAIQSLESATQKAIPASTRETIRALLSRSAVGAGIPVMQQYGPSGLAAALMLSQPTQ